MSEISITRLYEANADVLDALNRLLPQLSPNAPILTLQELDRLVSSRSTFLFVATVDGELAGMLALIIAPIPTGFHGYIEDVVVDNAFRGRGIAEKLVRAALETARELGADKVDLTSSPLREAANRLYVRVGFELRETNVYRYLLR